MKKIFSDATYGPDLIPEIEKWINSQTLTPDGSCKVFRPVAVIELFDQNGEPLK